MMNKKLSLKAKIKKMLVAGAIALSITATGVAPAMDNSPIVVTAQAATKTPRLSCKSATIFAGRTKMLKVTGASSKVKWTSSNKSIVVVNSNGLVKGVKPGLATIRATIGKKTLSCKIRVLKASTRGSVTNNNITYKASFNNVNKKMNIIISNKSRYAISLGWANNLIIVIKTDSGKTYVEELNLIQSMINTGNVRCKIISSGASQNLTGTLNYISGNVKQIGIYNIYSLNNNSLPTGIINSVISLS